MAAGHCSCATGRRLGKGAGIVGGQGGEPGLQCSTAKTVLSDDAGTCQEKTVERLRGECGAV